jgi:hypothetical protein
LKFLEKAFFTFSVKFQLPGRIRKLGPTKPSRKMQMNNVIEVIGEYVTRPACLEPAGT